ncbi:MAG: hypothetical protein ACI9A1_000587, partial [Lentimonas sp.]
YLMRVSILYYDRFVPFVCFVVKFLADGFFEPRKTHERPRKYETSSALNFFYIRASLA